MSTVTTSQPARVNTRTVIGVVIGAALVVWIVTNRQPVSVSFWLTSATLPLWVALTIAGVVGCAVGFLLARRRYQRA